MDVISTALDGVWKLVARRASDERGWFVRTFDAAAFSQLGLVTAWASVGEAFNARAGTLRGLHLQRPPHAETKLIRCTRGAIFDVLLDARPESRTYGTWMACELHAGDDVALYAPEGVAHGYQTLCDDAIVQYAISAPYEPAAAGGFRYDSPVLAIPWPRDPTVVSARDRALPAFEIHGT